MKALIVVNLAGFLTFLWNDIKTLQEKGYEIEVAMNGFMADGTLAVEIKKLEEMGVKFYQVDFDSKNPFSKTNYTAYIQIKKILKNNYTLIHCHTPIVGFITRIAANKYRRKGALVIYTTHGFSFTKYSSKRSRFVYYTIEKFASRFCDAIITINHDDYNEAKQMHCPHVYIIPSVGLDFKRFNGTMIDKEAYREKIGIKKSDKMILTVGELSHRKNHQIIIRALSLLSDKFIFVICGRAVTNSNFENELKELAEKKGVRLILLGHRSDIPEINKCADVFVIPSIREGLGMAGLEALASGLPVVGSNVQGIKEYVINEETGFLCNPYDEREFSEAINKVINLTEQDRERMRKSCIKMALRFDIEKSKKAMKDIYEENGI